MNKAAFLDRFHHPRTVSPETDYPLRRPGKPAAVLLPVVERDDQLTLLFTQRARHLKHHGGQVSFPGGKVETYDNSLLDTALRETREEIGLKLEHIQVVGNLHRYRTISGFEVLPFVALIKPPFELTVDHNEVDDVFEVPIEYALNKRNHLVQWVERKGYEHPVYFIPWENRNIWGATASFVRNLANHIRL